MNIQIPDCKKFNGYKPCKPYTNCLTNPCNENEPFGTNILIINLDAMGDVLMTTARLHSIKRKYPVSSIYWVTLKNAVRILDNNPFIHKVYEYGFESSSVLQQIKFDVVMNIDKSQRSCALADSINAPFKYGFGLNQNGQIIPYNDFAQYNYLLGIDDELKFRVNKKTGEEYLSETLDLPYERDEYVFNFSEEEKEFIQDYKQKINVSDNDYIIGFNTGCSVLFPNKKMTIEQHIVLIERFLSYDKYKIMLLGGPEDTERNSIIAEYFGDRIISTPTNDGLRRGACYESIPQVIITGDSFGMHLAIALKKYVIVWFGLSCWEEIDLFDRGIKLTPEGLECAPCWKRVCPKNLECIQMIDLLKIENETINYFSSLK